MASDGISRQVIELERAARHLEVAAEQAALSENLSAVGPLYSLALELRLRATLLGQLWTGFARDHVLDPSLPLVELRVALAKLSSNLGRDALPQKIAEVERLLRSCDVVSLLLRSLTIGEDSKDVSSMHRQAKELYETTIASFRELRLNEDVDE